MEKYVVLQGEYDCYAISNQGNVKNLRNGYVLNPSIRSDGYKSVLLSKDGKKLSMRVHRLVAMYFLENPKELPDVNHINGIKHDNRASNLEWCTESMNSQHALESGLITTKYTNKTILVYDKISGELLFTFESVRQCAKFLGVNPSPIYRVLKGDRSFYKDFTFKYVDRI